MSGRISALVVGVAAVASIAGGATTARAECGASVRVSGDADVAKAIRASLMARGLGDVAVDDCASMEVVVERAGPRLRLAVIDGFGRRSDREVRDSATAIALIESWARPEVVLGDDLPGAGAPEAEEPSFRRAPAPRATPNTTGIAVVAGLDYARDATTWQRVGAAACVATGPVCIGGRLEIASPLDEGSHPRRSTSLAATVELPRGVGRVTLVPGVGVAGTWATLGGLGLHADETDDIPSLRAVATVAVRLAVARGWAIELELGGEAEAFGATHPVPGSLGRAGLGLRYGAR